MSAEFPTLAETVARGMFMASSVVGDDHFNEGLWEHTSEMMREDCRRDARAALNTLREACTIRTEAQIDALPYGSGIRDGDASILTKDGPDDDPWLEQGGSTLDPVLPALLIWHPEWATS